MVSQEQFVLSDWVDRLFRLLAGPRKLRAVVGKRAFALAAPGREGVGSAGSPLRFQRYCSGTSFGVPIL